MNSAAAAGSAAGVAASPANPSTEASAGRLQPPVGRLRQPVLNASFDALSEAECVAEVRQALHTGRRSWLCTVNVAILMMMRRNAELSSFVRRAGWVVADGQPVVTLSRWIGNQLPERVTGVDLMERLCAVAAQDGFAVFLLGSTPEHVEAAAQSLRGRYPGLVVHTADGYFPLEEGGRRARQVAQSGAQLLFVGMGVPRQEIFIDRYFEELGATVVVGVGGSFDVIAGLRSRAPRWAQKHHLEWAFRLAQEPRRLWRRYLVTNTQFAALCARELLRTRGPGHRGSRQPQRLVTGTAHRDCSPALSASAAAAASASASTAGSTSTGTLRANAAPLRAARRTPSTSSQSALARPAGMWKDDVGP